MSTPFKLTGTTGAYIVVVQYDAYEQGTTAFIDKGKAVAFARAQAEQHHTDDVTLAEIISPEDWSK